MEYSDAFNIIVSILRDRDVNDELDFWKDIDAYVYRYEQSVAQANQVQQRVREISPLFLQAAWELALLGVLRPAGASQIPDMHVDFNGTKYLLTAYGAAWVKEGEEDAFVPVGSETFITLLEPFTEFGPEFIERAREASRCWRAKAFLACCAMCGAAAEAILIALAIEKTGDSASILETYNSKAGRRKIESLVTGTLRAEIKGTLSPLFGLVKYWRDQASHGATAGIRQAEARTALQTLYLYAKLTHNHWREITMRAIV